VATVDEVAAMVAAESTAIEVDMVAATATMMIMVAMVAVEDTGVVRRVEEAMVAVVDMVMDTVIVVDTVVVVDMVATVIPRWWKNGILLWQRRRR